MPDPVTGEALEDQLTDCQAALTAAEQRIRDLEAIVRDTLWMARRYADGRMTYATGMYNDAARTTMRLGLEIKPDPIADTIWARDGMGPACGNLTPEEHAQGKPPDYWHPFNERRLENLEQAALRAAGVEPAGEGT